MSIDPRLENIAFLTLAAFRRQRRLQQEVPDWRHSEGLASLLEASRAVPQRDPWDLPTVGGGSGLARLLAEARQWQQEGDGGT